LIKLVKDFIEVSLRNADAGIFNFNDGYFLFLSSLLTFFLYFLPRRREKTLTANDNFTPSLIEDNAFFNNDKKLDSR